jgi:hypothetical protein
LPYLVSRSVAGTLMSVGHASFAYLLYKTLRAPVRPGAGPTTFAAIWAARGPVT